MEWTTRDATERDSRPWRRLGPFEVSVHDVTLPLTFWATSRWSVEMAKVTPQLHQSSGQRRSHVNPSCATVAERRQSCATQLLEVVLRAKGRWTRELTSVFFARLSGGVELKGRGVTLVPTSKPSSNASRRVMGDRFPHQYLWSMSPFRNADREIVPTCVGMRTVGISSRNRRTLTVCHDRSASFVATSRVSHPNGHQRDAGNGSVTASHARRMCMSSD